MSDKEKQPDGYCAWHPEQGWMLVTIAHDAFHCRDILEDQLDADGEGSVSDWFFRPVWFSTTPPMTEDDSDLSDWDLNKMLETNSSPNLQALFDLVEKQKKNPGGTGLKVIELHNAIDKLKGEG